MENNIKTVLLAIFILLIAIVSFSFNEITGQGVKDEKRSSVISIVPDVVKQGEIITVTVKPGDYGVFNRYMRIYREGAKYDSAVQATEREICGYGNRCKDTAQVKYRIEGTWEPGNYYVRVWEAEKNHLYENEYVQAKFTVEENPFYKT